MCGIAGTINLKYKRDDILKALFHRGPNEQSSYRYKNVNLLHTRLSIQDIDHGQQPYSFNQYVVIFNGEIYNHQELRDGELSHKTFRTTCDSEVIVHLYEEYGFGLVEEGSNDYDAIIVAVNHSEYCNFSEEDFSGMLRGDKGLIVDLKGIYKDKIKNIEYWSL